MDFPTTQKYLVKKYSLRLGKIIPITIPRVGRAELAGLFTELGFKKGAEIGTEQGNYAEILCKANPKLHLFCVDPWRVYDNNLGYLKGTTQKQFETFYKETVRKLRPYKTTILRAKSMEAVKRFKNDFLDFVYIDANHRLEYVIMDIVEWAKRVRPGGIIAGHDFIRYKHQHYSHVAEALLAYNGSYRRGLPWFILDSRPKDKFRSWFFVKQ